MLNEIRCNFAITSESDNNSELCHREIAKFVKGKMPSSDL